MEHTWKMVLIPQESINKLKSIENKNENTILLIFMLISSDDLSIRSVVVVCGEQYKN